MAERLQLYPDQEQAVALLRAGIKPGSHLAQILMAPCGAGKTIIGAYLLAEAYAKGTKAVFLVDRVSLVDQTSAQLRRFGIAHGILQASNTARTYEKIQVCSAQTLERRGFSDDIELLIIDEAHSIRQGTIQFIKRCWAKGKKLIVIGLTATPFTRGLGSIFSNLVTVTTTHQLIAEGRLVPLKMYAATAIDMTGAKLVAGEWSEADMTARGMKIVGDIVSEWEHKTTLHFGGPAKTIVFAASVAHGAEICAQFQRAGFNFQQISYKDGDDVRRRLLIEEFRKPDSAITGLVSCEVFSKGFDVPDIRVGISARPYRRSLSSHMQQIGRVMRSAFGKQFGLWLDHSGNLLRFYHATDAIFRDGLDSLDAGALLEAKAYKEPKKEDRLQLVCKCGSLLPPQALHCPACGATLRRRQPALVETVDGAMHEIAGQQPAALKPWMRDRQAVYRQIMGFALLAKSNKNDPELAKRQTFAIYLRWYGEKPVDAWWDPAQAQPAGSEVRNMIKHDQIAFYEDQKKKLRAMKEKLVA